MNTIILIFLLTLFFSIKGFYLNKAELYDLKQKSKGLLNLEKKTLEQNTKKQIIILIIYFILNSNV